MTACWNAAQAGTRTQGILTASLSDLEALQAADVRLDPENAAVQSTVGLLRTYTGRLVAANPSIDVARDPALEAADPLGQLQKEIRVQQILFNRALGPGFEGDGPSHQIALTSSGQKGKRERCHRPQCAAH